MSDASIRAVRRGLTLSALAAGLVLYLPLHLAGIAEALLMSGPPAAAAATVAALFAIPIVLVFTLYMPLLVNPITYLWMGVVMEGLVVTTLLWGRTGRVSRLLLVLIALAIPTAPWVFTYRPAVAPAPGYRMAVLTQPGPLEGVVKHAQMWMEIVPSKYTLLGWDSEEAFYYSEEAKDGSQRLWTFRPSEEEGPTQVAVIPSDLQEGARVSVLDRVRAPGTFKPEDEPSVRAAHVRGSGLESPSGRWVAAISRWVYGPEDVVVLTKPTGSVPAPLATYTPGSVPTPAPTRSAAVPAPSPSPSAAQDAWTAACQQDPAGTATVSRPERSSVSGRAVSVGPDRVVVSTPDQGCVELPLSSYDVWDNLWVKNIPIEVGDDIFASDTPFGPKLYVNIVNLIGVISNVRREGDVLTFDLEYGPRYGARGGKDTIKVDGRANLSGSGPREGQGGQVVGRRLEDGSVLGVTVFLFDGN